MTFKIEFLRDEKVVSRHKSPALVSREVAAAVASGMFGAMRSQHGATEYQVVDSNGRLRAVLE